MKLPMKVADPTPRHQEFRNDLIAVIRKYQDLRPDEMLAIASYFVGQLVALQDQRKLTPAMAMEIVGANIEHGNQHAISEVESAGGLPS